MRARTVIILVLLMAAGGGVIYYYERQINLLSQLTFKLISIQIGASSMGNVQINTVLRMFSQSTIDATVQSFDLDLLINGQKLAVFASTVPFVIPAKGYADAPITVNFSPFLLVGDLAGLAISYLTGTQDYTINLIGYVRIKEAFLTISVPFTYNTTLKQILSS